MYTQVLLATTTSLGSRKQDAVADAVVVKRHGTRIKLLVSWYTLLNYCMKILHTKTILKEEIYMLFMLSKNIFVTK